MLCFFVGILGSIYGIGGGSIVAPFLVAIFKLPVYTVAGAVLMGTFMTSVTGVLAFHLLAGFYPQLQVAPDWSLGIEKALTETGVIETALNGSGTIEG